MQIAVLSGQGVKWTFTENTDGKIAYQVLPTQGAATSGQIEDVAEGMFALDIDEESVVHVLISSRQGHLIHMMGSDGRQWSRQTLSRLQPGSPRLVSLMLMCDPHPIIVYQLQDSAQDSVVCYAFKAGRWGGRRLMESPVSDRLRLLQCLPGLAGGLLLARRNPVGWHIERLSLEAGSNAAPQLLWQCRDDPQGFHAVTYQDRLFGLWVCGQQAFVNEQVVLSAPFNNPCLLARGNELQLLYATGGELALLRRGSDLWQSQDRSPVGTHTFMRWIEQGAGNRIVYQWAVPFPHLKPYTPHAPARVVERPVERTVERAMEPVAEAPLSAPSQPSPLPAYYHGLEETLRAQATLLQRLHENIQGYQQRLFTMDAHIQRLQKDVEHLQALRIDNAAMKLAMAALESQMRRLAQ